MANDLNRRVAPGDRVRPSAERENAITEAIRAQQAGRASVLAGEAGRGRAAGQIEVKNASGSEQPERAVLGIDTAAIAAADNLKTFQGRPAVIGKTPTAEHAGRFVILAQPLDDGKLGLAWSAGTVAVKVDMVDAAHRYADVKAGDATQLQSCESGVAQILSVEAGTGSKWAYVRLGGGAAAEPPAIIGVGRVLLRGETPLYGSADYEAMGAPDYDPR